MLLCVTKINVFLTALAMDEMIKTSCSVQFFTGRSSGAELAVWEILQAHFTIRPARHFSGNG